MQEAHGREKGEGAFQVSSAFGIKLRVFHEIPNLRINHGSFKRRFYASN